MALAALAGCGRSKPGKKVKLPPPINPRFGWSETGVASWYGEPYHGRITANGETYDMNKMTAAHKRLPFDTWLRVRNLSNGRETRVRVNDRGPFVGKRIIDLSKAAASDIGMLGPGTARVRLTVVRPQSGGGRSRAPNPGKAQLFDIQIGVFANPANARGLADKARKDGHKSDVQQFSQGGETRYRVVVTGGNLKEANARLERLHRQGHDGFLRPR